MPSRVRIRLVVYGNHVYGAEALLTLNNMYQRSLQGGFSHPVVAMPKVKWRMAIALYQNLKSYAHHHDPGMKLLVVRERRGERLRKPALPPVKKKLPTRASVLRIPHSQGLDPVPAPQVRSYSANWNAPLNAIFGRGVQNANIPTVVQDPQPQQPVGNTFDQVFGWNVNDLNR